jgi:hypothetical protein
LSNPALIRCDGIGIGTVAEATFEMPLTFTPFYDHDFFGIKISKAQI